MKRKIIFEAEREDLGKEKIKLTLEINNGIPKMFCGIRESTDALVEEYKDDLHKFLTDRFHVSKIKIK